MCTRTEFQEDGGGTCKWQWTLPSLCFDPTSVLKGAPILFIMTKHVLKQGRGRLRTQKHPQKGQLSMGCGPLTWAWITDSQWLWASPLCQFSVTPRLDSVLLHAPGGPPHPCQEAPHRCRRKMELTSEEGVRAAGASVFSFPLQTSPGGSLTLLLGRVTLRACGLWNHYYI